MIRSRVLAVAALACVLLVIAPGCGDGQVDVAGSLCHKAVECGMSNADYSKCVSSLQKVTTYIVDAAAVVACINNKTCAELATSASKAVEQCMDHDQSSFKCNGDMLHYCNNKGICVDADCKVLCSGMGLSYLRCGSSSSSGHPIYSCKS